MIRHGLWTVRVSGERRHRYSKLLCQPPNKRLDGLLQVRERNAGMAKQSELNGKANTIGISASCRHQVLTAPCRPYQAVCREELAAPRR
jgi:hypothetical protein